MLLNKNVAKRASRNILFNKKRGRGNRILKITFIF